MNLHGRDWTRRELEARVGRIEQLGGVRKYEMAEGSEQGNELLRVRTGAGLSYDIVASKGLDISLAEFAGSPLSWQSPNGDVSPAHYVEEGTNWLRTASGGLLMTCGLMNAGSPSVYKGKSYGMHGRAHHTPARQLSYGGFWHGDRYEIKISGVIEETSIFGGCLRLYREISSELGVNRIMIRDVVENIGFADCPHMMLYHFNFGYPLMTEQTEIRFPQRTVRPREAGTSLRGYDRWTAPISGVSEGVFYHEQNSDDQATEQWCEASIVHPAFPIVSDMTLPVQLRLRWQADTLPNLVEWHMPGEGVHVLGIEPANCHVGGIASEAAEGKLKILKPGETVRYNLQIEVLTLPNA